MSRVKNNFGTLNAYIVQGDELMKNDRYGYKIIAVIFDENTWCVYRGLTDWEDEEVVSDGSMIPYDAAKILFPTLAQNIANYQDR